MINKKIMLKNFIRKAGKIMLVIAFLLLLATTVGLGIAFYVRTRELNDLKGQYSQAQQNINSDKAENDQTINSLEESFRDLNKEVSDLKKENNDLKRELNKQSTEGYGEISGKIFPFIIGDSSFSQYQLVCAENVNNKSIQHCVTVSALDLKYKIVLPAGKYQVYSRVVSSGSNPLTSHRAPYTEYIKCVQESGSEKCSKAELSTKIISVEVKAGQVVNNVDPIDWQAVK